MLITQIAFDICNGSLLLLIAFVANPLLDQLYSLFSVSEHPMQAGSTVQSVNKFFVCPAGGGGGGRPPWPPPLYPPLQAY